MFSFTLQQSAAKSLWQHKQAANVSACLIKSERGNFNYDPIMHASLDDNGARGG